jgi:DNA-binding GntR family transcriptional regulator
MVSAPSLEEAIDLYEVRASLESLVVQHFVERATDAEVDKLRKTVRDVAKVAEKTDDTRQILGAKDGFYTVLIAGARSAALQQLIEQIQARVQVLRATSLSEEGRAHEMVAELEAIVEAIAQRDAPLASKLTADHIRKASVTALHSLRESETV